MYLSLPLLLPAGDVASIDRFGYMRIQDRSKDVVKSGGEWISSIALENAAMGHPKVRVLQWCSGDYAAWHWQGTGSTQAMRIGMP
jgi:acyl-CoA synthetase (AMP-forming)/AMP-acid ligase II